jgi:CheY-like chemotaxis protein
MARVSLSHRAPGTPTSLLCIDDRADYLPVRKAFLESQGYQVFTACSGREGLEILGKTKIDAVVLDYRMPEMSGAEVAREIRRRWPKLPVILLSGYPHEIPPDVRALVQALVVKGSDPSVLLKAIEGALPNIVLQPRSKRTISESIEQTKKYVQRIKEATAEHWKTIHRRKR